MKPTTVESEMIMIGSMLVTFAVMAAYPILALVLLNRPNTKAWFANRPE